VELKRQQVAQELQRLASTWLPPSAEVNTVLERLSLEPLNRDASALQLLRRPRAVYDLIAALSPSPEDLSTEAIEQVVIEARYAGYIERQRQEVERQRRLEEWPIPASLDYGPLSGLRAEAVEKLMRFRPVSVGQAARIEGVSPADISVLLVHLRRLAGQAAASGAPGSP
jgi:tRNA uridine 5-carboxymethylaminomethyl modification enzyme